MAIPDKFLQSSDQDVNYLLRALRFRQLSGTADIVDEYEQQIAQQFASPFAIAMSSGSTALQAALYVLDATSGTEVLVPAIAPLPSLFPITANGAVPVPVDIRPESLDFDPDDLRSKISSRTRAAIIVPLWGYPVDLTETLQILNAARIPLVEDAAHAHGASANGKAVGTAGALGCFSTHDRKLLATGEGGFILTASRQLAEAVRSYSRLGNLQGAQAGVNFKLNGLAAALGLARLQTLQLQIDIRRANATELKRQIGDGAPFVELHYPDDGVPNYYNLILIAAGLSEKAACRALEDIHQGGIPIDQIKYGYDVFYRRPVYNFISANCPNAENFVNRVIQFPVHPDISSEHIGRMAEIVRAIQK